MSKLFELVEVLIEGKVYRIPRCEAVDGEALHSCGEEYLLCESCGILGCEACDHFDWQGCLESPGDVILVCGTCVLPCKCTSCSSLDKETLEKAGGQAPVETQGLHAAEPAPTPNEA